MKTIKKLFLAFCVIFTLGMLLTGFVRKKDANKYFPNGVTASFRAEEIHRDGNSYIVVTTSAGGVAICKK